MLIDRHEASEAVWAIVSGLPTGQRERRLLIVLQAFFDDSGSEPGSPYFVLAGYVAPVAAWTKFSDDWAAVLRGDSEFPELEYFKMSEAMGMRDQFDMRRGWTPAKRDKLLLKLVPLICEVSRWQISASMKRQDFEETLKLLPAFGDGRTLANDHPYGFLWYQLVTELWLRLPNAGEAGPCDFIFDHQLGFEDEAVRYWKLAKGILEKGDPKLSAWIPDPPVFRNDVAFNPLQAADMYAWLVRRYFATGAPSLVKVPIEMVEQLADLQSITVTVSRDYLDAQYALRTKQSEAILRANPTKKAHYYEAEKSKRDRKKGRAKVAKKDREKDKA